MRPEYPTRGGIPPDPPGRRGAFHGGYPPANWGRTSMTAASGRITPDAAARLAAAPSTRKEDAASTRRRRPSSPRRARTTSSASASVPASTESSFTPAGLLAAAQYWIVTVAIWDILL